MGSVGGAVRRVVDGMTSELKVYFYACYDKADKQAYSGLTIGLCAASVREDVRKNFRHPKYISIHRVPELAVAVDGDGREYIIPQGRQSRRDSERFEGAEGSVSPVGCCRQRRQSDPQRGSETMSTTGREVRMIERPGMGPSKKASDDQSGCMHRMGRPKGGTCEPQRKGPRGNASPMNIKNGCRPSCSLTV